MSASTTNVAEDTPSASDLPIDAPAPLGEEKRRHRRYLDGTKLEFIPGAGADIENAGEGDVIQGWAQNISNDGIGFVCLRKIQEKTITVRADVPETGAAVFELEIVRCREVIDGLWDYGALFRGLKSSPFASDD